VAEILRELGYVGLTLLLLAENLFPPIPSEAILPLAGYLVERGELSFGPAVVAATAGSVVGAVILYELARQGGRPFVLRFARFARIGEAELQRGEDWFAKRGIWVVLLGRFVPGVRSVVSLPAGLLRMNRVPFLLLTTLGSACWNALLIGAGYWLGSEWERVSDVIGPLSKPLLALAVVAAIGGVWWALRRRRTA
jgi:membrane protein DedA with SNARE-associated domain